MTRSLTRGVVKADGDDSLFLVELDELAAVAAKSQALAGIDEAVQRLCADASGSDGVDGELRPGDKVAAGEDVVLRGLAGDRVNDHGAVLVKGHALGGDAAEIDLLTDRADNAVDLDGLILAGVDGLAAAVCIRFTELHTLDLERTALPSLPIISTGALRKRNLTPLSHRLGDLFFVGGHFGLTAAVDYIGVLCTAADCGTAHVHCDVAAADDGALRADSGFAAEVDLAQKVDAAEHAFKLLAGNANRCGLLSADGEIEALQP